MLRVALVTHKFPSREHPYITDWVNRLHTEGIDVTILAEAYDRGVHLPTDRLWKRIVFLNDLKAPGHAISSIFNVRHLGFRKHVLACLYTEHKLKKRSIVRKFYEYLPLQPTTFDIVHFNAPQIAVRRFELGQVLSGKTLVSFRGQDFTFYPDRYDRLLKEADHLHFISKHLLDEAHKRGYNQHSYSIIPPVVDTAFYHPPAEHKPAGPPFTLFTAARFSWTKGWEYALQAAAILIHNGFDLQYFIAGDGELREAVAYTIRDLGIADRVHLLGWISPEQVRSRLWQTDVYVLTSVDEAFNNSVLQAQACGVPVVCSDTGGLPENVEDGVTGLVARRRDAHDTAAKIEQLLTDRERRIHMGENGRKRTLGFFAVDRLTPDFIEMYRALLPH